MTEHVSLRSAAADLRRPFTPEALKWKFQTIWPKTEPTGGLVVAYIDRGLVIDRLNVLLPHLWSDEYQPLERGMMRCRLTIDGVTREDVGEGTTDKARYSDSLKRAAVKFGIGVSLTRVPQAKLTVNDGTCRTWSRGQKEGLEFTQAGLDYLRERYVRWLDEQGITAFGDPLSHGDTGDAQGDDESPVEIADIARQEVLLAALTDGEFTIRQQRGLLAAAGVGHLADVPSLQDVAAAVRGLSDDQAVRLGDLITSRNGS